MLCFSSHFECLSFPLLQPTAKKATDPNTRYDGQFWHHIDKWLFALVRAHHVDEGVRIAKSCFPSFFYPNMGPYHGKGGMHHKLSVDATPPPSNEFGRDMFAYDDTLNALVVFSMLEQRNEHKDTISLQNEINQLRRVLHSFGGDDPWNRPPICGENDPTYWGMEAIFDQFVAGHPRTTDYRFRRGAHLIGTPFQHSGRPWLACAELMGAIVDGTVLSEQTLEDLLTEWVYRQPVRYYFMGSHPQEADRKAGMARVMLAMALLSPGVLKRRTDDVMVQI